MSCFSDFAVLSDEKFNGTQVSLPVRPLCSVRPRTKIKLQIEPETLNNKYNVM